MNELIKEIAKSLETNMNDSNSNNFSIKGLNSEQMEQLNNFAREFGKSAFFPFPLKSR